MNRGPPGSTLTHPIFPHTTLIRSEAAHVDVPARRRGAPGLGLALPVLGHVPVFRGVVVVRRHVDARAGQRPGARRHALVAGEQAGAVVVAVADESQPAAGGKVLVASHDLRPPRAGRSDRKTAELHSITST